MPGACCADAFFGWTVMTVKPWLYLIQAPIRFGGSFTIDTGVVVAMMRLPREDACAGHMGGGDSAWQQGQSNMRI